MLRLLRLALVAIPLAHPAPAQVLDYPAAPRADVVDTLHGVPVADPYRWMEDLDSDAVRQFAAEQNALLDRWLSTAQERRTLRERIAEIADVERNGPFHVRGGRSFVSGRDPGQALTRVDVHEPDGRVRRVVEAADVVESPEDRFVSYAVDRAGRRMTIGVSRGQSRWRRVRVLDLESGRFAPETLVGIRTAVVWDETGAGFFYVGYDPPADGGDVSARVENPRLRHHRVGTSQADDRLVWEDPERPERGVWPVVTRDGRWLLIHVVDGGTFTGLADRVLILDLHDPDARPEPLLDRPGAGFAAIETRGSRLWFRTDLDAPRGRILALDLDRPREWTEIVPERDATLANATLVAGRLLVERMVEARPRLAIHDLDGRLVREMRLPDIGNVGPVAGDPESPIALFGFNSLYEVGSIYRLDPETGEVESFRRPEFAFDPDDFITRQEFYESADGTRIPIFVAHRRDVEPDGTAPAFLYAYGAFAWIAFPWFQPHVIEWMERGGVYALPNIRGGGVYGEAWHRAGMRRNKENGIADYLAAAEWLIESGWARPGGVVANGGSASGVLAAAAVLRRPRLFGAAVIDIPALDQIRYHRFSTAASWIPEFGSADDPEDFQVLRAYSPYHNVPPDLCHPATLVIVGERDEIAPPFHGYKHAAALQHAQACPGNPVLIRTIPGAGHSYGTDRDQFARTWGDAWAFLERTLSDDGSGRRVPPRDAEGRDRQGSLSP